MKIPSSSAATLSATLTSDRPAPIASSIKLRKLQAMMGCYHGQRLPSVAAWLDINETTSSVSHMRDGLQRMMQALALERAPLPTHLDSTEDSLPIWVLFRLIRCAEAFQQQQGIPTWGDTQLRVIPTNDVTRGYKRVMLTMPCVTPMPICRLFQWLLDVWSDFESQTQQTCLNAIRQAQLTELLTTLEREAPTGTNNREWLRAAYRLRLPWIRLTPAQFQYGWGRRARWLQSTLSDATPAIGVTIARNKSHVNQLLSLMDVPVARQLEVHDENAAVAAAIHIGYPVVVKPADRDGGKGAKAGLSNEQGVRDAFVSARQHSQRILVEQYIPGNEYRLTMVRGTLFWAHERVPAMVTGDGYSSLQALIEKENARRETARQLKPDTLRAIDLNDDLRQYLEEQGLTLAHIPAESCPVRVQRIPMFTGGGDGRSVNDVIHPDNVYLAERVVALLRMDIAAVDFITPDIAHSWRDVGGAVIEVNAMPQLSTLTASNLFDQLLKKLIDGDGRIPIVTIHTEQFDETWLLELAHALQAQGLCPAISTPSRLYVGERLFRDKPRLSAFNDVRAFQLDPTIGVIILVSNGLEFLQVGLPFDVFDFLLLASPIPQTTNAMSALHQLLNACRGEVLAVLDTSIDERIKDVILEQTQAQWTGEYPDRGALLNVLCGKILAMDKQHANS